MRVLIYGESERAKQAQAAMRAERHHASLRNPQFFNPGQFDRTPDLVVSDDAAILAAYRAVGIAVETLTVSPQADEPAPGEVVAVATPESAPAAASRRRK